MSGLFVARLRFQRCLCVADTVRSYHDYPRVSRNIITTNKSKLTSSKSRTLASNSSTFYKKKGGNIRSYSIKRTDASQTYFDKDDFRSKSPKCLTLHDVKKSLHKEKPEWFESLLQKQESMCTSTMPSILLKKSEWAGDLDNNSNLQLFLAYICDQKCNSSLKSQDNDKQLKSLNEKSVETAFTIILHTILKTAYPQYRNGYLKTVLDQAVLKYKLKPSKLFISHETLNSTAFSSQFLSSLIENKEFQLAIQLLKIRLAEANGWKPNLECRDDNVIGWINALVEPSVTKALLILTKSKFIPEIIAYDLLSRTPENELEFRYFFEFYKSLSTQLNFIDQEKLFHMRSLAEDENDRSLRIPPLFNNLFKYALRCNTDKLPQLTELFLKQNNAPNQHTITQLSELIWILSYDHTGEHFRKPSRYYQLAQSQLIETVNLMTKQNKALEIDVVTMLAVSNMESYRNGRKAFTVYKNAKKQFDHWQLREFKPEGFKEVTNETSHPKKMDSQTLYNTKVDYNIRFLCNSILLLTVNEQNVATILHDLLKILSTVEPQVLRKYPEIWSFVTIKLAQNDVLLKQCHESAVSRVYDQLLRYCKTYNMVHPFVLDYVINRTNSVRTLFSILENLGRDRLDDNNRAHMISRLYKLATVQAQTDANDDVVQAYNCLSKARSLYEECVFKSTRINSSHLLGEAIFAPDQTYEKYNSVNAYFKITQLSIASLFVSVFKLHETGKYSSVKWGDEDPLNFAMKEFEVHICRAYGDTESGLLYPNDRLLTIYANVLREFSRKDDVVKLLYRLVDLKYPVNNNLFEAISEALPVQERKELIRCLNEYDYRFETLRACRSEYELKRMKKALSPVVTKGAFEDFVNKLEFNWGVVKRWHWPDRRQHK